MNDLNHPDLDTPAARPLVLIVDDDAPIRGLLGLRLQMEGYATLAAADGLEALNVLSRTVPDAIVTDLQMPRVSGFALCRHVRAEARTSSIPIVLFTGSDHDPGVDDICLLGRIDHVDKLDGCDSLLPLLARVTQGRALVA
jgi:CheY-like chemotaxis protein